MQIPILRKELMKTKILYTFYLINTFLHILTERNMFEW